MRLLHVFIAASLGVALASRGEDLTTLTGQTYTGITVQRYDWEGIFIRHAGGISKIPYSEIPAERREYYKKQVPAPVVEEKPAPVPPADAGPGDLVTRSGALYRNAVPRRVEEDAVLVGHDGGLARVPFADIPDEARDRFRTPVQAVPEPPPGSNDLVAADGQVYRNVQVRKIDPDSLTVQHDGGLARLEFPLLPEEWQAKYEYDPKKAAAHQRAVVRAREEAERNQQAVRGQNEAGRKQQIRDEPIRVYEVRTAITGPREYRVRFSVRNYDDKPRTIMVWVTPFGIREFTIPPHSSKSDLEVFSTYFKPEFMKVTSGSYSTSQLLTW